MIKRLVDIAVSFVALVALCPVWMAVFLYLLFAYRGEKIIFTQQRIGLSGKRFTVYKFRTLKAGLPAKSGHGVHDETPAGKLLRKFSLDELPQLVNVLKGDMSLVGPRPLPVEYEEAIKSRYAWRLYIKPGLTGPVQVGGRNKLNWQQRFERDFQYYKDHSFFTDLKILALTPVVLLKAEGDVPSENLLIS